MNRKEKQSYLSRKGWLNYLKAKQRRQRLKEHLAGYYTHLNNMRKYAELHNKKFIFPAYSYQRQTILPPKPQLPYYIQYLKANSNVFSNGSVINSTDGVFQVPECFSLLEHYEESFEFLRSLFLGLLNCKHDTIILDYQRCRRIDVDASICMDLILSEYINYLRKCRKLGHIKKLVSEIKPINYNEPHVMRILFSIGAYRNIKGFQIKYEDVEPLPVLVNYQGDKFRWNRSEIHLTEIVEYIKTSLSRLNRELTQEAETEFYKVIGEIMSNAEEHSTTPHRFAIGFFQEHHMDEDYGIFNFSIFNFGKTIYETFKSDTCGNPKAVQQMTNLSYDYTKRGFFKRPDFQEETLWTLYALQEGVTSKEKKRGNGSIQYIENFFKLKGDMEKDNLSKLLLLSGNSRIEFDGTYPIFKKSSLDGKRAYKMITFNKSQDISDKPDNKFVTFAPHYFPGTLLSARILIKADNTNLKANG